VLTTVAEATGRDHRRDPCIPRSGGPAGNARITAWTGLLLLVLFLAELVTLIDVEAWIGWHVVIGALLLPPALVKTASTGWRIVRYYTGDRAYRVAGPPPMPLRVLGPAVVATTLGLLISGIVLIALGPDRSRTALLTALGQRVDWVSVHQGFFILWAAATGLHLLGRLLPALGLTVSRPRSGERVDGRVPRSLVQLLSVATAVLTAVLLFSAASAWRSGHFDFHDQPGHHRAIR
jgi:hypothetical protein